MSINLWSVVNSEYYNNCDESYHDKMAECIRKILAKLNNGEVPETFEYENIIAFRNDGRDRKNSIQSYNFRKIGMAGYCGYVIYEKVGENSNKMNYDTSFMDMMFFTFM